jgi:hypothetical protein
LGRLFLFGQQWWQLGEILVRLEFRLVLASLRRPTALSESNTSSRTAPDFGAVFFAAK